MSDIKKKIEKMGEDFTGEGSQYRRVNEVRKI